MLSMLFAVAVFNLVTKSVADRQAISKIALVQHSENERYAAEVELTRQDGKVWREQIRDIQYYHSTSKENQMIISLGERDADDAKKVFYVLRFGNLPQMPFFHSDLLFATLFARTDAVYIENKIPTVKAAEKPVKHKRGGSKLNDEEPTHD